MPVVGLAPLSSEERLEVEQEAIKSKESKGSKESKESAEPKETAESKQSAESNTLNRVPSAENPKENEELSKESLVRFALDLTNGFWDDAMAIIRMTENETISMDSWHQLIGERTNEMKNLLFSAFQALPARNSFDRCSHHQTLPSMLCFSFPSFPISSKTRFSSAPKGFHRS